MKNPVLICALLIFLLPAIVLGAYAHPGGTDSSGGHTNHSTEEYHYHHGYPAHDHYDMDGDGKKDCPYDFDDKADHNRGDSDEITSSIGDTAKPDTNSGNSKPKKIALADIFSAMFEHLFGAIAIWLSSSYFLSYIFFFIFEKEQGCYIAMISGAVIALAFYIWLIMSQLS